MVSAPATALAVGLKVDVDALPRDLVAQLRQGRVDLDDPATTLALLRLDSVVGVTGFFNEDGSLRSLGIQCALCHSTVDDSSAPGIGHRLDGFANRDLNVGAIVNLSPDLRSPDNVYKTMNWPGFSSGNVVCTCVRRTRAASIMTAAS